MARSSSWTWRPRSWPRRTRRRRSVTRARRWPRCSGPTWPSGPGWRGSRGGWRRRSLRRRSTTQRRARSKNTSGGSATSNEHVPRDLAPAPHAVEAVVSGEAPSGFRGALRAVLPQEQFGDHLAILAGTGQNIAGLVVFVVASLGANIVISRGLGPAALGVVTLATQFAFIGGAATRFGMDMAATRLVAIDVGRGAAGRARPVVLRAAAIAAVVSGVVALAAFLGAGSMARIFGGGPGARCAFRGAALALPFVA